MTVRLEAYLYGTPDATMADAVGIQVTEPGPVTYTARLTSPDRLTDALTTWAAALTASALAGTYSLTWDAARQAVTISATGVASFDVVFGGNLAAALGFSSPTGHTGALSYSGDQQALGRFDGLRGGAVVVPHEGGVDLRQYRHGRHRAIAWSDLDTWEATVYGTTEQIAALVQSYCAAGQVRLYPDESVGTAFAEGNGLGYVDGTVILCTPGEIDPSRGRMEARVIVGVPHG